MSDREFYEKVIDLIADWQEIVEDATEVPEEAIAVLSGVVRQIVLIAEETNPEGYHTEVFNIVQH